MLIKKNVKGAKNEAKKTEDVEFEAKYTARLERKKIEKSVAEMSLSIDTLKEKAADAKVSGMTESYHMLVDQIKVAMLRKKQAEAFLYKLDAMLEMQKLAGQSESLLKSMGVIMEAIGKLTIDESVIKKSRKTYTDITQKLDNQSKTLDKYTIAMKDAQAYEEGKDIDDSDIEKEIDDIIINRTQSVGIGSVSEIDDKKLAELQKRFNSNG